MAPHQKRKSGFNNKNKNNKKPFEKKRFDKNNKKPKVRAGEFDLEKARQEVFTLGIKGFKHKDKQEAKRDLAIKLGAIPKKPRGKNIKKHMEEVRERKLKQKQEREERESLNRPKRPEAEVIKSK